MNGFLYPYKLKGIDKRFKLEQVWMFSLIKKFTDVLKNLLIYNSG